MSCSIVSLVYYLLDCNASHPPFSYGNHYILYIFCPTLSDFLYPQVIRFRFQMGHVKCFVQKLYLFRDFIFSPCEWITFFLIFNLLFPVPEELSFLYSFTALTVSVPSCCMFYSRFVHHFPVLDSSLNVVTIQLRHLIFMLDCLPHCPSTFNTQQFIYSSSLKTCSN